MKYSIRCGWKNSRHKGTTYSKLENIFYVWKEKLNSFFESFRNIINIKLYGFNKLTNEQTNKRTMGSSLSLIHLPAQSGKTRKMTELINKWKRIIDLTDNSSGNINIIFTSNTKLLTKQTTGRIHNEVDSIDSADSADSIISDLSDDEDDNSTMSIEMDIKEKESKTIAWISEKKKKSVNDVFTSVLTNKTENIICCTNKIRMNNVWQLLQLFRMAGFNKQINIWIDEADACIKLWETYIPFCGEFNFIQNIVLITATMVPVYKRLHRIGIEPFLRTYENTHAPVYHKYSESDLCHEYSTNAKTPNLQIIDVLDKNPDIVSPGVRLFCPGNKAKKSHEEVCDTLLENGFNVLILNGEHKEIRFADKRPEVKLADLLETDLEVSITLNRLYYECELFNAPFAVTGNLCVGRGITFASQIDGREFLFTHGIIPEVSNGDEGYQMVARCCGNIKGYANYQIPKIFVSDRTNVLISQQESLAIDFAKNYFQGGDEPMVKVTREMLKDAIGPDEKEERAERKAERVENLQFILGGMNEFETLEDANSFCKKIKKGAREEKHKSFLNDDGEYVCTTTKKGLKKFSYEEFMRESGAWNATSLLNMKDLMEGKVSKVIKPVYRGDEVVWIVRWAVHIKKAEGIHRNGVNDSEISSCRIVPTGPQRFIIMRQ
jgi:hypothetical protein